MKIQTRSERKRDRFEHKVFSRAWEGKNWRIIVGVYTYRGGPMRLMISREHLGRKYASAPFAKLGKLTREELAGILPLLQEALLHMK